MNSIISIDFSRLTRLIKMCGKCFGDESDDSSSGGSSSEEGSDGGSDDDDDGDFNVY